MHVYETHFAAHGLAVAQLLLTHQDLDSRTRYANAQNTLNRLLEHRGIVPIINENDSVAVEELRFGDNDRLSAEVAILARANLLIVLTSAEGLTPRGDATAGAHSGGRGRGRGAPPRQRRKGSAVDRRHGHQAPGVKRAVEAGIPAVIANGRTPGLLERIVRGEQVGTRFEVPRKR